MWSLWVLSYFSLSIGAHSTYYNVDEVTCRGRNPMPKFYSYHIHVLFLGMNNVSTTHAMALREEFGSHFFPNGIKLCPDLYHQDYLCMFPPGQGGPFITDQWAVFVPLTDFGRTVSWIMQRRMVPGVIKCAKCQGPGLSFPALDIMVHPNSGCEYPDHMEWPLWGGQSWHLDMTYFTSNSPGNHTQ